MSAEPATVIGLLALIVSNVGMWLKIIVDGRKKNNNDPMANKRMNGLHTKVEKAEEKAALAAENSAKSLTAIESFRDHCATVSGALSQQVAENRQQIFDHVSGHK